METNHYRCCGIDLSLGNRHVPAVAGILEIGCVVFEYGHVGLTRSILRHGNIQTDTVCYNHVCGTAWFMAVSKSI